MYAKAFAKINVYLDVVSKRKDGYHDLNMVMLPLELHDTIEIEEFPLHASTFIVNDRVDKEETKYDLIRDTINALREKCGLTMNYNITVHKEIPIFAGLGGGSSNAAAVLKAICKTRKIQMAPEEELKFALSLGADVPFCMRNIPAHVEGIGDKISPITLSNQWHVIIIKPSKGLGTKKVFEACDKFKLKHADVNKVIKALETGDEDALASSMFNSLEEVSIKLLPEIQDIKDMLKKDGFKCTMMTGSGSCVFALTKDVKKALSAYKKYDRDGYNVILTKTLKIK